ncbi:hypothetical protein PENNAL_c0107G03609 [Penicillium nalgiovense]|uniref:Uncharacterized protein n=1 Tax=Penicillium nalgiovense TaxID=60175 RepID=A0A1V6X865_PENNA|nr:hypothetical protein PENNAL_c0107G03609 [Penicillium nalgiovense]
MLAEREAHIVAEEESDWCWEDPKDKKHYKLRTPHLERLIDYVDEGGILDSHDDIPSDIRRDLSLKARQEETQNGIVPVITSSSPKPLSEERLLIAGPRESAVRVYCKWLESRATEEPYKADFRKICQVILENHLDLELILEDPDSGFFVQVGFELGLLVASCVT